MTEKTISPQSISPLHRRMIDDMTIRALEAIVRSA
jgi:hypothetical protein